MRFWVKWTTFSTSDDTTLLQFSFESRVQQSFSRHITRSKENKRKVSGLWSYKWIHLSINNSSDLRYSYLKLLFSTHGCTETRGSISYPNTWLDHLDSWFLRASVLHQPYHTMVKFATTNHTQVRFVHRKIYHHWFIEVHQETSMTSQKVKYTAHTNYHRKITSRP